jgi:hypothetical protein
MKYEEHKPTKRTPRTQAGAPVLFLLGTYAILVAAVWVVIVTKGRSL